MHLKQIGEQAKRGTRSLRNNVLYFCGDSFEPERFRGWKYFAEEAS